MKKTLLAALFLVAATTFTSGISLAKSFQICDVDDVLSISNPISMMGGVQCEKAICGTKDASGEVYQRTICYESGQVISDGFFWCSGNRKAYLCVKGKPL